MIKRLALYASAVIAIIGLSAGSVVATMTVLYADQFIAGSPASGPFGNFACHETRSVMDWHCVEDWNVINASSSTPQGYASFDARPTLNSTTPEGHFVGFQSRPQFNGLDDLEDYFDGVNVKLGHTGTGIVDDAHGVRIMNPTGTGPIANLAGIVIEYQSRGTNNSGLISYNSKNFLAGIQANSIEMNGNVVLANKTVAQLNAAGGADGSIAFASDGCKVWQSTGSCTGVMVYRDGGYWYRTSDDTAVHN